MKRRIISTYADTPIKNIKTPIRKINYATGEDEISEDTINYTVEENDAVVEQLQIIKVLLIVIIALKVICLIIKK